MHKLESELHDLAEKVALGRMTHRRIAAKLRQLSTESHWYAPPKRPYIRRLTARLTSHEA